MKMVRSEKLIYEYEKRDEEGNVIGMNRAVDGVEITLPRGTLLPFWDTTVRSLRGEVHERHWNFCRRYGIRYEGIDEAEECQTIGGMVFQYLDTLKVIKI